MKNNRITVRFEDEEYTLLLVKASQAGLSVSDYVRETSLSRHIRLARSQLDIQAYRTLSEIASSLQALQADIRQALQEGRNIPKDLNCQVLTSLHTQVKQLRKKIAIPDAGGTDC